MLRVISGSLKGRILKGPKGLGFRPTTGRVKEFVFEYLKQDIRNAKVLDLFSGTGSLGIEAISRGAEEVFFIEQALDHLSILRNNLKDCDCLDRAIVMKGDVFSNLRHLGLQSKQFDIVLADPPFKMNYHSRIVDTVGQCHVLKPDGLLLVEHEQHDMLALKTDMSLIREKKCGHCIVSVYQKQE